MINFLSKMNPFIIDGLPVRWYALFILSGAVVTFLVSRMHFKKGGFSGEIADNILITAFPMGIIGARLWYCLLEERTLKGFISEFANGGLAIQGGVLFGAATGILLVLLKYKQCNIFFAMDCVIPNILIAQAIGRWGNFANQEVYGACVDASKLSFLPKFIQDQMAGDYVGSINYGEFKGEPYYASIECQQGEAAVPLFLIESIANIIGWVLITFVLRKYWNKGRKKGDLSALYFIWYGIVRAIMEPFRNPVFQMGMTGNDSPVMASYIVSILFIIGGVLFMVALRVIPLIIKKKEPKNA